MSGELRQQITDQGSIGKYFALMLHIDDDELDPYEYRLLGHYRRVCGATNKPCFESTLTTAKITRMSDDKVRSTRDKLVALGRIIADKPSGSTVKVTICDLMDRNVERYSAYPSRKQEGADKPTPSRKQEGGTPKSRRGGTPENRSQRRTIEEETSKKEESIAPATQVATPISETENSNPKLQEKALEPLTPSSAPPPTPLPLLAPPGRRWIFRSDNTRHLVNANAKQPQRTACHQEAGSHAILVGNPLDYVECAECKSIAYRSETFSDEIKNALATLCKRDWRIKTHQKHMNDALSQIVATGPVTIELLRRFYVNWRKCDFRGQKGQFPSPAQVVEKWTEYTESDDCKEGLTNERNNGSPTSTMAGNRASDESAVGGVRSQNGTQAVGVATAPAPKDRSALIANQNAVRNRSLSDLLQPASSDEKRRSESS